MDGIRLPEPFSVARLVETVSEHRGRPLELVELPGLERMPCGVLVATDRSDYIGYPADTTRAHQQHVVLHKIGHLLCGHLDVPGQSSALAAALAPHLSLDLVRRVLGLSHPGAEHLSHYGDEQEQEAELVASLIALRATAIGRGVPEAARPA
ncbi:ParH-like protein [Kitasatospora sp. LaBMicrA B282]|uniref:ParH-like protein n=1 Tax=Kitasatospora sp. LaBMicrA B282 TaxID=3420949 RepID=UPI003D12B110